MMAPGRRSPWAGLRRDQRGAAALELGLLAVPLLTLVFFIVSVGLQLFVQNSMDLATLSAARQIRVGAQRGTSDATTRAWICNQMATLSLSCSNLQIYVTSGTSFGALTKATVSGGTLSHTGFSPGSAGAFVLVQVAYPLTALLPFMPSPPTFLASAVFQNEI